MNEKSQTSKTHSETLGRVSQELPTSLTSIHTALTESSKFFIREVSELAYILEVTAREKLREELSKISGGSPDLILTSRFQTDQSPDGSFQLTFSMELKKSSNPS